MPDANFVADNPIRVDRFRLGRLKHQPVYAVASRTQVYVELSDGRVLTRSGRWEAPTERNRRHEDGLPLYFANAALAQAHLAQADTAAP